MLAKSAPETIEYQRRSTRHLYTVPCILKSNRVRLFGQLGNISEDGVCVELRGRERAEKNEVLDVYLGDFQPICGVVVWTKERTLGVEFIEAIEYHSELIDLLEYLKLTDKRRLRVVAR